MKTPIIHPDTDLPEAISDFQLLVRGENFFLTWAAPDSKRRSQIIGYKVFFREAGETKKVPLQNYRELAFIDLEGEDTPWNSEDRVILSLDVHPEYFGKRHVYVVVPVNRKGFAGHESEIIAVSWQAPPPPPVNINAQGGDRSVLLQWKPGDGGSPSGFNLYRRLEEEAFPLQPLNPEPVTEYRFIDQEVQNGTRYIYLIRAIASEEKPWIESLGSREIAVEPLDRVAPSKPKKLEVIAGVGFVRLFWNENNEKDMDGYRIYKRTGEKGKVRAIGDVKHPMTVFTDKETKPGVLYEYSVTAYDNAPSPNESKPSKSMKVRP